MKNESIKYSNNALHCDAVTVAEIAKEAGTPAYIYSLPRALANYERIKAAFSDFDAHIHYSAKANANLSVLRTLINAGAGIDCVSGGEIHRALTAGAKPDTIVFAGVGKSPAELRYAIEKSVGWFNVENVDELRQINGIASELGKSPVQIALRLNPDVSASTHPNIATGHGAAKFGMTADVVSNLLKCQSDYPLINFAGIHIHIGSQLHDVGATAQAVQTALELMAPHSNIRTINIGGGLPVAYSDDDKIPSFADFAATLQPLLKDYTVLLEPGRSIIADAGILIARILYVKKQAGQTFYIVDASMTELLRPMLYGAQHQIIPVNRTDGELQPVNIVGPVCETTDILARSIDLPQMHPGDLLAILTCGAYGMVIANNYNARPRPPEIVINQGGNSWEIARRRETWDDLLNGEI